MPVTQPTRRTVGRPRSGALAGAAVTLLLAATAGCGGAGDRTAAIAVGSTPTAEAGDPTPTPAVRLPSRTPAGTPSSASVAAGPTATPRPSRSRTPRPAATPKPSATRKRPATPVATITIGPMLVEPPSSSMPPFKGVAQHGCGTYDRALIVVEVRDYKLRPSVEFEYHMDVPVPKDRERTGMRMDSGGRYWHDGIWGPDQNPRNAAGGTIHVSVYVMYEDGSVRTLHRNVPLLPCHR